MNTDQINNQPAQSFSSHDSGSLSGNPAHNANSDQSIKKFTKATRQKTASLKYIVLLLIIVLASTVGFLYFIQQQQQAPTPTEPPSKPAAADGFDCTLTFDVKPPPFYPQCLLVRMHDKDRIEIDPSLIELSHINAPVFFSCQGNVAGGGSLGSITSMKFQVVKRLLDENHNPIDEEPEVVWRDEITGDDIFQSDQGNIATGFSNSNNPYYISLGQYAAQCQVCIEGDDEPNCTDWEALSWPALPEPPVDPVTPVVCVGEEQTEITTSQLQPNNTTVVVESSGNYYVNVELRVTDSKQQVRFFRDPQVNPFLPSWTWNLENMSLESISAIEFYVNVDPNNIGQSGESCGSWSPN